MTEHSPTPAAPALPTLEERVARAVLDLDRIANDIIPGSINRRIRQVASDLRGVQYTGGEYGEEATP